VKNKSYAIFTKGNARVIRFEHEHKFFKGMKADNTIMDIQLSLAWCENVFELVVHPKGMDGSADHAVCVVDDIVLMPG
jgi:hypothetical protein